MITSVKSAAGFDFLGLLRGITLGWRCQVRRNDELNNSAHCYVCGEWSFIAREIRRKFMKSGVTKCTLQICILSFGILLLSNSVSSVQAQTDQRRIQVQPSVNSLPSNAKRYALIVGVDEYQDTQINKLGGASNDAKALAEALVKFAGFPAENVILLTSAQAVDKQPTRANILRRLSNLRQ